MTARIALAGRRPRDRRPAAVNLGVRYPLLGRMVVRAMLALPHGRVRSSLVGWMAVELTAGHFNRKEYADGLRAFGSPTFRFEPAPELSLLVPMADREPGQPLIGPDAAVSFVDAWMEEWDDFTFVSREVVDFGDGRFLLLHHLEGTGTISGVGIAGKEEAQLWEFDAGALSSVRQWWTWEAALAATGVQPMQPG